MRLWHSVTRVVCLEVNVRAPGILSRLQAEMRAGEISDAMWNVYISRIIFAEDPRLTDPDSPLTQNSLRFVVHRHRIRVMRALENAKTQSKRYKLSLIHISEPTRPY